MKDILNDDDEEDKEDECNHKNAISEQTNDERDKCLH